MRHRRSVEKPSVANLKALIEDGDAYTRLRRFNLKFPRELEELLLENRMWFSAVAQQDDRFEGKPPFKWPALPPTATQILELCRRHSISEASARAHATEIMRNISVPVTLEWMKLDIEKQCAELFGSSSIASFFRSPFVQEQWDRYAGAGTGYALVFDLSIPWTFCGFQGAPATPFVPFEVTYVPHTSRPVIELKIGPANSSDAFDDIRFALLTKAESWSPQREERFIRVGVPAGHVKFPPESLRGIVLGYDILTSDKEKLLQLATTRATQLPVLQARESTTHYALEFVPLFDPS